MLRLTCEFLTCCVAENNSPEYSKKSKKTSPPEDSQPAILFSHISNIRLWEKLSPFDRCLDIFIPEITSSVVDHGAVLVYMCEVGKHISLPFTYYQTNCGIRFQPSYARNHVYINILGDFIVNVSVSYSFKIIIVDPSLIKKLKGIEISDYQSICNALGIKDHSET